MTGEITNPMTLVFDKLWKIRHVFQKSTAKTYLSRHLSETKQRGSPWDMSGALRAEMTLERVLWDIILVKQV